jgi:hypothetical protein
MQDACLPFGMIQDFRLFDKPHNISASRLFPLGDSLMTKPIFPQIFKGEEQ